MNTNLKILIVDDFTTMRKIIKSLLKQLGFQNIDEAENGKEALNKLEKDKYDLVLSDWNMPIMEGIELLKKIRTHSVLKNITVIMITAEVNREKVIEAIKSGADGYVVKPFTPEILKEKIEKALERKNVYHRIH